MKQETQLKILFSICRQQLKDDELVQTAIKAFSPDDLLTTLQNTPPTEGHERSNDPACDEIVRHLVTKYQIQVDIDDVSYFVVLGLAELCQQERITAIKAADVLCHVYASGSEPADLANLVGAARQLQPYAQIQRDSLTSTDSASIEKLAATANQKFKNLLEEQLET